MEWHKADPVDSFEIRRNDVIYSFQKNRNPFIDHPEYVESIWDIGTASQTIKKPIFKVYPNPATDYVWVEVDGLAHGVIYSLNGMKIDEFETRGRVSVQDLNSGIYILQIATSTNVFNSQLIIQ